MCGRFAIFSKQSDYLASLDVGEVVAEYEDMENYNAYPTQNLPVLYRDEQAVMRCDKLHWGLLPSWAKDTSIAFKLSNARSETASEKPSFRHAFKQQRCMVPVDGWYEWKREGKNKQPYYHHKINNQIIWLAGLWESWVSKETGELIRSFTILTQDATGKAQEIHNRMPVFMDTHETERWLDKQVQDVDVVRGMMEFQIDDEIELYPVSKNMNSPKNMTRECIQRI